MAARRKSLAEKANTLPILSVDSPLSSATTSAATSPSISSPPRSTRAISSPPPVSAVSLIPSPPSNSPPSNYPVSSPSVAKKGTPSRLNDKKDDLSKKEDTGGVPGGEVGGEQERVRVTIRVRPMSAEERKASEGLPPAVHIDRERNMIALHRKGGVVDKTDFEFDAVLAPNATQEDVYEVAAKPVVLDVLQGYNGTVMAYGQTGAGKTHTLSNVDSSALGIVPRAVAEVFNAAQTDIDHDYRVTMSYIQIYMEMLQDLLRPSSTNLAIRESEHGVYVEGVEEVQVADVEDCLKLLHLGERNRTVAFTKMNAHSSRSHALALLTVEKRRRQLAPEKEAPSRNTIGGVAMIRRKSTSGDPGLKETPKVLIGKLFLVDLAGSERLKKSGSEGVRLSEAKSVNLSLTVLGKCISARADPNATHIPFRDSKLTRLLQESLGGNAKTSLVVCVGPCLEHASESLSSLLFGARAMKVRTRAIVNETEDFRSISQTLQEELDRHDEKLHQLEAKLFTNEEQLEQAKASLQLQSAALKKLKSDRESDAAIHRKALADATSAADERLAAAEAACAKELEAMQKQMRIAQADARDRLTSIQQMNKKEVESLQGELQAGATQRDGLVEALGKAKAQIAGLQRQVAEMQRQQQEAQQAGKAEARRRALEDRMARRIQRMFRQRRFNKVVQQLLSRSREAEEKGKAINRLQSEKTNLEETATAAGRKLVADAVQHVEDAMNALLTAALGGVQKV